MDGGGITFFPAPAAVHKTEGAMVVTYDATNQITWFDHAAQAKAGDQKDLPGRNDLGRACAGSRPRISSAREGFRRRPRLGSGSRPSARRGSDRDLHERDRRHCLHVEVENQGAYVELAAGASLTYPVKWYLRTIPSTVTVASGDMTLYTFAAGVGSGITLF